MTQIARRKLQSPHAESVLLGRKRDESIAYSSNRKEMPGVRGIFAHIAP
jgi:hypothetical protein